MASKPTHPHMTVADETVISKALDLLIASARSPAELTLTEADKLGEALERFGAAYPTIADRSDRWLGHTAKVLAAADVKRGDAGAASLFDDDGGEVPATVGTWEQITRDHSDRLERKLKTDTLRVVGKR